MVYNFLAPNNANIFKDARNELAPTNPQHTNHTLIRGDNKCCLNVTFEGTVSKQTIWLYNYDYWPLYPTAVKDLILYCSVY